MLELGACMEKEKSCGHGDNRDDEFAEISFEELLAQEKKDSFWLVLCCSFAPFFLKFVTSWSLFSLLFSHLGEERLSYNSPITTFFCICTGKKMGNQDYAQVNNILVLLTVN